MAQEMQAELVKEIADLVAEYRKDKSGFVKFGLKCGLALNVAPIACGIMHAPKQEVEQFRCSDTALREKHHSDKNAFYAALDQFAGHGQFLAWNGVTPPGSFDLVRDMSENFSFPTMMAEMLYRRKGQEHENRLSMFFIGFANEEAARDYATRHAHLLK